jgi:hypothetical protein
MDKAYEYRGERRYIEGVPFGGWQETGDHYVTGDGPLWDGDVELYDPRQWIADHPMEALRVLFGNEAVDRFLADAEEPGDVRSR